MLGLVDHISGVRADVWRSFYSGSSWPRWLTKAGSPLWPRRAWSPLLAASVTGFRVGASNLLGERSGWLASQIEHWADPLPAERIDRLVRTDRHNHRSVVGDTSAVEAVKVLARGHQSLIWARTRHTNALRCALREYYPVALEAFDGSDTTVMPWPFWAALPRPPMPRI